MYTGLLTHTPGSIYVHTGAGCILNFKYCILYCVYDYIEPDWIVAFKNTTACSVRGYSVLLSETPKLFQLDISVTDSQLKVITISPSHN